LGINIGDEVVLRIEDDELRITTLKRRIQQAQRLVRKHVKPGRSLVDELIAERRAAARNE
jgi:antitoxin PrlF